MRVSGVSEVILFTKTMSEKSEPNPSRFREKEIAEMAEGAPPLRHDLIMYVVCYKILRATT